MIRLLWVILLVGNVFALDRVKDWGVWSDLDSNCLNTREEVLKRDGDSVVVSKCNIVKGVWLDFYTGDSIKYKSLIDIDHIVSLKDAERSGALKWGRSERVAFANDLENLVVTHRSINRSKSDKTPLEWTPPVNFCIYIDKYIRIKTKYKLSIDPKLLEQKTFLCMMK